MRQAFRVLWFTLFVILIFATLCTVILSFYLANLPLSTTGGHSYTILDGLYLLVIKAVTIFSAPSKLTSDQRALLYAYGNSIIYVLSIAAVFFSTVTVWKQVAAVNELVPFQKYDSYLGRALGLIPTIIIPAKWQLKLEHKREAAYKNLSVKKMIYFYKSAERLLIISGDYSWLFDNAWSEEVRRLICEKIPYGARMISYQSPDEVAKSWSKFPAAKDAKAIFQAISFNRHASAHKASVVSTNSSKIYIHLYQVTGRFSRQDSVCAFFGEREAGALISFVNAELENLHERGLCDSEYQQQKAHICNDGKTFNQS